MPDIPGKNGFEKRLKTHDATGEVQIVHDFNRDPSVDPDIDAYRDPLLVPEHRIKEWRRDRP